MHGGRRLELRRRHSLIAHLLSIVVPILDEAEGIAESLQHLQPLRENGHEVIIVDGGSTDGSVVIAMPLVDCVIFTEPGRARQMNAGAAAATGDVLIFLHADTTLPARADQLITEGLEAERKGWGRFDVRLSGRGAVLRLVEAMMNLRSRVTGIATGDQAIFVRREWFDEVDGYPDQSLMEDLAICRRLCARGRPLCISAPVVTSSRRWEEHGPLRTILKMWSLRAAYFFGADPEALALRYSRR